MASYTLKINDKTYTIEADPRMPLLWAIRDLAGLTGTKYGCGIAQCGACTVHMDGVPVRSCSLPVSAAATKRIVTIEGLSDDYAPRPTGVDCRAGAAMRILSVRTDHGRYRAAEAERESYR